jgi:hypothetical protein
LANKTKSFSAALNAEDIAEPSKAGLLNHPKNLLPVLVGGEGKETDDPTA